MPCGTTCIDAMQKSCASQLRTTLRMSLPSGLGIICTPLDYERSLRDPSIRCLTRGDSFGLLIVVESALLSLLAVIFVYALISRNLFRRAEHLTPQAHQLRVFQQPMDLLMFSLFFADLMQSIGGIQNLKWILDGKVVSGSFCNSQGIIKNIGEAGVALNTLAITIYTVIGVVSTRGISSMKITLGVLSGIWGFILIIVVIGNTINHKPSFQAPVPHWCWISQKYLAWRIAAEYVWLWIALIFSFITYIPLYLWMRGNLVLNEQTWWKCSFVLVQESDPAIRNRRRSSLMMLAYPIAYCIIVIPLTIIRWLGFTQEIKHGVNTIPAEANFTALAIFGLSGFLNVALLLTTRPLLFGTLMPTSETSLPPSPLPMVCVPPQDENLAEDLQYSSFGGLP